MANVNGREDSDHLNDPEEAIADACLAGSMCGGCVPAVTEIIEEEQKRHVRLPTFTSAA